MGCGKHCECQITQIAFLRWEYFICLVFLSAVFLCFPSDCYVTDIGTIIPNAIPTKCFYFSFCASGLCLNLEVCVLCARLTFNGFCSVSGSYQNGKGSNKEIDHLSAFCGFSANKPKQYIRIMRNQGFSILAKLI